MLPLVTEPWDCAIDDDIQTHRESGDSPFAPFARAGYRACLRVPIRLNGEMVGLLGFFSKLAGLYTHED